PATQKQDIAEAAVAVRNPTRLPTVAQSALRYGGLALSLAGLVLLGLMGAALRSGGQADSKLASRRRSEQPPPPSTSEGNHE
ncbi:MAG TPA: hypothetical protein VG294_02450, partial [Solirubrobacteraceae bacterium]|nr:hypothetical protein [Solirubrobacteraceae bacterium]